MLLCNIIVISLQLNYNTTGRTAYIWNTDTSSPQYTEIILLIIMVLLALFTLALVMMIAIIVTTVLEKDDDELLVPIFLCLLFLLISGVCISFLPSLTILLTEFFQEPLYLPQYSPSLIIQFLAILSSFIFGLLLSLYYACCGGKNSDTCMKILLVICAASFCPLAVSLAAYSVPVFIEVFIFPIEILFFPGIFVFISLGCYPVRSISKWLNRSFNVKEKYSIMLIKIVCYLILTTTTSLAINIYIAIMRQVIESPTDQISQILLAFAPTILAVIGTYLIEKKLESQKKSNPKTENTERDGDDEKLTLSQEESQQNQTTEQANEQSDQPTNDTTTNDNDEDNQETEDGNSRSDIQLNGASRESGPQEIVVVEVHQDDSSDGQCESTV